MKLKKEGFNLEFEGKKVQSLQKFEQWVELMENNWDEFSLEVKPLICRSNIKVCDGVLCLDAYCLHLLRVGRMGCRREAEGGNVQEEVPGGSCCHQQDR